MINPGIPLWGKQKQIRDTVLKSEPNSKLQGLVPEFQPGGRVLQRDNWRRGIQKTMFKEGGDLPDVDKNYVRQTPYNEYFSSESSQIPVEQLEYWQDVYTKRNNLYYHWLDNPEEMKKQGINLSKDELIRAIDKNYSALNDVRKYMNVKPTLKGKPVDVDAVTFKEGGKWLQKAVNPEHKGYCTPMTKSTCTPRRKAFAMTMKKHHGFHKKKQQGGILLRKKEGIQPKWDVGKK